MLWTNLNCSRKMWNPASANLTCDFKIGTPSWILLLQIFSTFFWKYYCRKQFWLLLRGVHLLGEYNTYCFDGTAQKQLPKQKYLPNSVLEIICSKKVSQTSHKVIFDKVHCRQAVTEIFCRRTPSQVFSYELCKVLKNTSDQLF